MDNTERATLTIVQVDATRENRVGVKTADGQWYSCWDKKLWPRLTVGASLNVELTPRDYNGKTYYNITGILGMVPSTNGAPPPSDRERNIVRESALRAACDLYGHSIMEESDTHVDFILHVADRFAAWINQTGEEAPF